MQRGPVPKPSHAESCPHRQRRSSLACTCGIGDPARGSPWTPALEAQLRALWAEGLPTLEIGRRLGMGKNSILGKAHRLKLPGRTSPLKTPPAPKRLEPRDLRGCRWIEGKDYLERMGRGEAIYCGAKVTEPGGVWCAAHRARVYHRPTGQANWFRDAFGTLTGEQRAAFKRLRGGGMAATAALKKVAAA